MQLYRVSVKVRPTKHHPLFWDFQFGFLQVWLYGESPEAAAHHAWNVVSELPYELPSTEIAIYPAIQPERAEWEIHRQRAMELGIALALCSCSTGTSEGDFETMEPI